MKQKMTFYRSFIAVLTVILALFSSCQREIDMNLPEYSSKLVVEGTIETGKPALVMLSKSIPYFSTINMNTLMNDILISGAQAEVFISSESGEEEQLTYSYSPDAPYLFAFCGKNILGKEETHYTLTVKYDGNVYTAETYIPKSFDLDTFGFDHSAEILNDTMATIRILMTDDASESNYYSFFCKVASKTLNDRLWVSMLPVAFDDRTFNGQTFNYEITRYGYSLIMRSLLDDEEQKKFSRITFRPGDTVYLKHSQIDYNTYKYLISAGSEAAFGSNPFTNPIPAVTNFSGENVIGHWSGFASKIDTLIWFIED